MRIVCLFTGPIFLLKEAISFHNNTKISHQVWDQRNSNGLTKTHTTQSKFKVKELRIKKIIPLICISFGIFYSLSVLHKNIHDILIDKQNIYLIFYNIYPLGHEIIMSIKNHVSLSKYFWSFSIYISFDGLYI